MGRGHSTFRCVYGDEPLALKNNKSVYYYHQDGLGSVVALTDSSGTVVQDYQYDFFGNLKDLKNRIKQPYTYTGREHDREVNLYDYRLRTYDPTTGTFTTKDPIGFAGGDVNLYKYVSNNPVNFVDPFGLLPYSWVPQDLINNVQFLVNNVTNNSFNDNELALLTKIVIKEIGVSEILKAKNFAEINPYEVPVVLDQKQHAFIAEILVRLLKDKGLTVTESGVVVKAVDEFVTSFEEGTCVLK